MSALTLVHMLASLRSFIAESEQMREQWVNAMRDAIGEALSNSEVAERIWAESSNSLCADCEAPKPEWAAINLCVVVCKQCAGLCVLILFLCGALGCQCEYFVFSSILTFSCWVSELTCGFQHKRHCDFVLSWPSVVIDVIFQEVL